MQIEYLFCHTMGVFHPYRMKYAAVMDDVLSSAGGGSNKDYSYNRQVLEESFIYSLLTDFSFQKKFIDLLEPSLFMGKGCKKALQFIQDNKDESFFLGVDWFSRACKQEDAYELVAKISSKFEEVLAKPAETFSYQQAILTPNEICQLVYEMRKSAFKELDDAERKQVYESSNNTTDKIVDFGRKRKEIQSYFEGILETIDQKKGEDKDEFPETDFDFDTEYQEDEYMLNIDGAKCIVPFSINAINGLKGQGKSQWVNMMIGSLLNSRNDLKIESVGEPKTIIYFDTELPKNDIAGNFKRLQRTFGENEVKNRERFHIVQLRDRGIDERLDIIRNKIRTIKPDIIFIDNIRDLVMDFNDLTSSSMVVNALKRLSTPNEKTGYKGVTIVCTLHLNPGSTDKMRGHIGTELSNTAGNIFTVSLDDKKKCFSVEMFVRQQQKPENYLFRIDEAGVYRYAGETSDDVQEDKEDNFEFCNALCTILARDPNIKKTDLIDEVKKAIKTGRNKVRELVSAYLSYEFIEEYSDNQSNQKYIKLTDKGIEWKRKYYHQ